MFPGPCLFLAMTGLYCPGCGGTRAVWYLLHGHLCLSFRFHPLVPYTAMVLLMEAMTFFAAKVSGNGKLYLGHEKGFLYLAVGIVAVNFAVKNYLLIRYGIDLLADSL